MSLLRKAKNETAYLKVGIQGFAGSGKTYTASRLAIGLSQAIGDRKPVAFFDTETGSDWLIRDFEEAGIELLVAKTRSFADLLSFMQEAEATCSVAIIDSITHVWTELRIAYEEKYRRRNGLEFQDWAKVKKEWQRFTDSFLNSRLHVIVCGRAGYEYEYEKDEETGKKDLVKTGTRMKTEGEMAYEPSLLIEMERLPKAGVMGNPKLKGFVNRAVILKDRTTLMNGEEIDYPTYESFRPIIQRLNIGGAHVGVDTSRNSVAYVEGPGSSVERKQRVAVVLEEIKNLFVEAGVNSRTDDGKRDMIRYLRSAFGTSAWTQVEGMRLEVLEEGLQRLAKAFADKGMIQTESATVDGAPNVLDAATQALELEPVK